MARGRMIDRSLTASKKLARLPERAALLYVIGVAHADVQGRLEADDLSLMEYAGRYGLARGWTAESIAEDRSAIADSGLWIVWGDGDDLFAQVVKFHAHNRTDVADESPSVIPEPEGYSDSDERRRYSRPPYHKRRKKIQPKGYSKATLPQPYVEQEPEQELEREREQDRRSPPVSSKGDIIRSYSEAYEAEFNAPCTLRPRDPQAAQEAADLGTFPPGRDLVPAFRRAMRALSDGGFTVSLRSIVNNADLDAKPAKKPKEVGPVYPDLSNLRAEMEAEARKP